MKVLDILSNELSEMAVPIGKRPDVIKQMRTLVDAGKFAEAAKVFADNGGANYTKEFKEAFKADELAKIKSAREELAKKGEATPLAARGPGANREAKERRAKMGAQERVKGIKSVIDTLYTKYKNDLSKMDKDSVGAVMDMTGAAKLGNDPDAVKRREEFVAKHGPLLDKMKKLMDSDFKKLTDAQFAELSKEEKAKYSELKKFYAEIKDVYEKKEVAGKKQQGRADYDKFAEMIKKREESVDKINNIVDKYNKVEDIKVPDLKELKTILTGMLEVTPTDRQLTADLKAYIEAVNRDTKVGSKEPLSPEQKKVKISNAKKNVAKNKEFNKESLSKYKETLSKIDDTLKKLGPNDSLDADDADEIFEFLSSQKFESKKENNKKSLREEILGNSGIKN